MSGSTPTPSRLTRSSGKNESEKGGTAVKRALHRDYFREIIKSRNRFFSILLIILIGVSFFAGIKATGPDMKKTSAEYYRQQNLMDIKLVSSYGVNQNDVECIKQIEGVADVMPSYTADAIESREQSVVKLLSAPQDGENSVNRLRIVEGRLPQSEGEAVIDERGSRFAGYQVGDTIELTGEEDGGLSLKRTSFKIVGIANSPQYITLDRGSSTVGDGVADFFLSVPEQDFDLDVYTEAYITLAEMPGDIYSDAYGEAVKQKRTEIEDALGRRKDVRLEEARAEGKKQVEDGWAELRSAEQKLSDAKQTLDDSLTELTAGQQSYDSSLAAYNSQIAQAEKKLREAKAQLDDGEKQYQSGLADYNAGASELEEKKRQLEEGLNQLPGLTDAEITSQRDQLNYALAQIAAGESQLAQTRQQVEEAFADLPDLSPELVQGLKSILNGLLSAAQNQDQVFADQQRQLEEALAALPEDSDDPAAAGQREQLEKQLAQVKSIRETLASTQAAMRAGLEKLDQIANADELLAEALGQISQAQTELASQKKQVQGGLDQLVALSAARAELQDGQQQIALAEQQLKSAQLELELARLKLDTGKTEYENGKKELETQRTAGKQQLDDAKQTLDAGWEEYAKGLAEYEQARVKADKEMPESRQKLLDAEQQLDDLEPVSTYTFDRSVNPGYTSYRDDSDRINNVASVFPVFFILVAALVCLTTMTRMVEEQRTQIGTLKALGYSKFDIMGKFLLYATLAALLGSVAGLLIGYNLFPQLIFNAYRMLYTMPNLIVGYPLSYSLVSIAAALACTTLTAVAVSYSELKPMPAVLMRPKAPKAGKQILLERVPLLWNRLSFIVKVTARNLFRYKKRMLMTVIGIAGCTALMLAGFGIKDSVSGISGAQFDDIYQYDAIAVVNTKADAEKLDSFDAELSRESEVAKTLKISQQTMDASGNGRQQSVNLVVPQDVSRVGEFVQLRGSGPITLDDSGAVITERLAQLMNVKAGDTLTLIDSDNEKIELRVSAVTEHYVQHYIYLTPAYYEQVFGEEPVYNSSLIQLTDKEKATEETLSSFLAKQDVVQQTVLYGSIREAFDKTIRSLDLVIVVLILSAAALAFVVLYNLTNINVSERMRELSTIKVLGFYDKEVSAYVYRENIVLTIIGVLVGLVLGVFLSQFVISTVETDIVIFNRSIHPLSYLLAGVLTFGFSLIVNFVIHFKLKKINMVEALKSAE